MQGTGDYKDEVELVECDRMCIVTIWVEEFILKRNKQEVDHRLTPQSIASVSVQLFWFMVYQYCKKKGGRSPRAWMMYWGITSQIETGVILIGMAGND